VNPVATENGPAVTPVEREYIGHRKLRVSMTDSEAAALVGFAFAGRPDALDGDLPGIMRRRGAKVALRKVLVARDRARVRFWDRVHAGSLGLAGLDASWGQLLAVERVYVSLTVEQAYALWSSGERGRQRSLDPACEFHPGPEPADAASRALQNLERRMAALIRRHRETRNTKEWFWGSCKDPLAWLPEKIALEKLHSAGV
jgi:hypothetical protein